MEVDREFIETIYIGWHAYQEALVKAITPLTAEQLELRASPKLRRVGTIAAHIIGARARWFTALLGGESYGLDKYKNWDRRGARIRSAQELVEGLEQTWKGMQAAIANWSPEDWQRTWPGEDNSEPEVITVPWVIWHLLEHDLHHGGEISLTLGANGIQGLGL